MFWRLHKALDDVVRAWQNLKAVDVMLVIDRSGSMSGLDSGGKTKLEAALDAVDNFADLLDQNRADGQQNRIGIVSYSSAANLGMPLTVADPNLRTPGGPLATAINNIRTAGPSGCTAIGAGIQRALEQLCPPSGDCRGFSAAGDNDRKAILVLTDGMENRPPCLNPAGPTPGGSCGNQCFGPALDFARLEFTQLVSVGFGNTGSLNGDLLTLLSERQGGIYLQNPNTPGDDLKEFYAKAFGQLTSDFIAADPKGVMAATDAVSDPVEYTSCSDAMITFASGWKRDVQRGQLRLLVTSPSENLVLASTPSVQSSTERLWAYSRIRMPYQGETKGTWRAQLIRPHQIFVNGFTPDSFADPAEGLAIVRRQIHRLCPEGCKLVLHYEERRVGPRSAYEDALEVERKTGVLGSVKRASDAAEFNTLLRGERWDLIVYARMDGNRVEPYDSVFAELLCGQQRAIVTETRPTAGQRLLRCAGALLDGTTNWDVLVGDKKSIERKVRLKNPGHRVWSVGLTSRRNVQAHALVPQGTTQAVVAKVVPGDQQNWFIDVLADGLSRLSPVREKLSWKTGDELIASVRVLPSDLRSGGYDHVDARVEVEYPAIGLGTLVAKEKPRTGLEFRGENLDPNAAALSGLQIPTKLATFPLFDDGTNGDLHPGNAYWSTRLPGLGQTDGMYRFRFILDFTVGNCTTRRELTQSIFVDLRVKPDASDVQIVDTASLPDGNLQTAVWIRPADSYGNLLGPGRAGTVRCASTKDCSVMPQDVVDHGDGSYTIKLTTPASVAGARLFAFGVPFDLRVPCKECAHLESLALGEMKAVMEHTDLNASIQLTAPAPKSPAGGALVYLSTSHPTVVNLPNSVLVPSGLSSASFPLQVLHAHGEPVHVTVKASYGGDVRSGTITITPMKRESLGPPVPRQTYPHPHPQRSESSTDSTSYRAPDPSGGVSRGAPDAPIVLVEFTDYQCPFCARAQTTIEQLLQSYPGQVRHIVKNFPLAFHDRAESAALAALAAERQGKFWEFRQKLFQNQQGLSDQDIVSYAEELGLDLKRFKADLSDPLLKQRIQRDVEQAAKLGVDGTPIFFINSERVSGAQPLTTFNAVIDRLLVSTRNAGVTAAIQQ